MAGAEQLHLRDLAIRGFRGFDEFSISHLGRVTLLAGRNGVGKTTVLDAVRVYVSRSDYRVLYDLLTRREELSAALDEDGEPVFEPDWSALFHGRDALLDTPITIRSGVDELRIEKSYVSVDDASRVAGLPLHFLADDRLRVLRVSFGDQHRILPCFVEPDASGVDVARARIRRNMRQRRIPAGEPAPEIKCESLGPGLLTNESLGRFWDGVALTDDEEQAVRALRLVFGEGVDRAAVIGDDAAPRWRSGGRRAVVRIDDHNRPVPLKSLGDGALRLFGVALALANSRDGVLLIDEVENGIHHSVQRDFWRMVLQSSQENNVQVLATTHSWDCVRGFALAAVENTDVEGVLVRLDRGDSKIRAVEYSEEGLKVAADQGIEVR